MSHFFNPPASSCVFINTKTIYGMQFLIWFQLLVMLAVVKEERQNPELDFGR